MLISVNHMPFQVGYVTILLFDVGIIKVSVPV